MLSCQRLAAKAAAIVLDFINSRHRPGRQADPPQKCASFRSLVTRSSALKSAALISTSAIDPQALGFADATKERLRFFQGG
jgi:hypothetical protein